MSGLEEATFSKTICCAGDGLRQMHLNMPRSNLNGGLATSFPSARSATFIVHRKLFLFLISLSTFSSACRQDYLRHHFNTRYNSFTDFRSLVPSGVQWKLSHSAADQISTTTNIDLLLWATSAIYWAISFGKHKIIYLPYWTTRFWASLLHFLALLDGFPGTRGREPSLIQARNSCCTLWRYI